MGDLPVPLTPSTVPCYLAPQDGIEPPTNELTARRSAAELLGNYIGAGKGNRTPLFSLEGCNITTMLYPHI